MNIVISLLAAMSAFGEDQSELGDNQRLRWDTELRIDVVDFGSEQIRFVGQTLDTTGLPVNNEAALYDPDGVLVANLVSGDVAALTANGTYTLEIVGLDFYGEQDPTLPPDGNPEPLAVWAVEVVGAPVEEGRVWSRAWRFDSGTFGEAGAMSGSFYAVVGGGEAARDAVVELRAEGISGFAYFITANDNGVNGGNGRSLPQGPDVSTIAQFPLYLRPPATATYNPVEPNTPSPVINNDAMCEGFAPPVLEGTIDFDSDVFGTWHLICDLNDDGVFDLTSDVDFHQLGRTNLGLNKVPWTGVDNLDNAIPVGQHQCIVKLTVSEFHYVASDIETSYPGFRLFHLLDDGSKQALPMFWNDSEVQPMAVLMDNGEVGLEQSGPDGVFGLDVDGAAEPNVNARSWGDFSSNGKGADTYLDTYTWVYEADSEVFEVEVFDITTDTDGDGLLDVEETCIFGTDINIGDVDEDGLLDGDEVLYGTDPFTADTDGDGILDGDEDISADTDGDGLLNGLDDDDDGDGILTLLEGGLLDSDGDGLLNYLDNDDDGDGLLTSLEDLNADGVFDEDSDGDGLVDYLDDDDDDDGVPTADEDRDSDGDARNDDYDFDGVPDYLDDDDDNDHILTIVEFGRDVDGDGLPDHLDDDEDNDSVRTQDEDPDGDGNPLNDDTDGDGIPNYLDDDDDDDGLLTILEDANQNGDPLDDDADQDSIPNYLELDDDGDGIETEREDLDGDGDPRNDDTDGDGIPNFLDADDDNDTVPSFVEGEADPDGDGIPNYLDPDDDNDGIDTKDEGSGDSDLDSIPDYLDLDADNDSLPDSVEGLADDDNDQRPNFQDADDDGDGISTFDEVAEGIVDDDNDGLSNHLDPDDDGDTLPTLLEGDGDADGDGVPNYLDLDSDNDGLTDEFEQAEDGDSDGLGDFIDFDSDGDSHLDSEESSVDSDGDGILDFRDTDDDGDGIPSELELGDSDGDGIVDRLDLDDDDDGLPSSTEWERSLQFGDDVDGDGLKNWVDPDSDNDGILDKRDGLNDDDEDGIPNFLDPTVPGAAYFRGGGLACSSVQAPSGLGLLSLLMLALVRRRERCS